MNIENLTTTTVIGNDPSGVFLFLSSCLGTVVLIIIVCFIIMTSYDNWRQRVIDDAVEETTYQIKKRRTK